MKRKSCVLQHIESWHFCDLVIVTLSSVENPSILWPSYSLLWNVLKRMYISGVGLITNNQFSKNFSCLYIYTHIYLHDILYKYYIYIYIWYIWYILQNKPSRKHRFAWNLSKWNELCDDKCTHVFYFYSLFTPFL